MKMTLLILLSFIVHSFALSLFGSIENRSSLEISDTTMAFIVKKQIPKVLDDGTESFYTLERLHFVDKSGHFEINDDSLSDDAHSEHIVFAVEGIANHPVDGVPTFPEGLRGEFHYGQHLYQFPLKHIGEECQNFILVEKSGNFHSLKKVYERFKGFKEQVVLPEGHFYLELPVWQGRNFGFCFEYTLSIGDGETRTVLGTFCFYGNLRSLPATFPDSFSLPLRALIPEGVGEVTEHYSFTAPFDGSRYTLFDTSRSVSVSDISGELNIDFMTDTDWERIEIEYKRNEDRELMERALSDGNDSLCQALLDERRVLATDSTHSGKAFIHCVKNPQQILMLVDAGADPFLRGVYNYRVYESPWAFLHNAIYYKCDTIDAQKCREVMHELLDRNLYTDSILTIAVNVGDTKLLERALQKGVRIDTTGWRQTPFMDAICNGDTTAVKLFLQYNAVDITRRRDECFPLDYAIQMKNVRKTAAYSRVETILLEAGAIGRERFGE